MAIARDNHAAIGSSGTTPVSGAFAVAGSNTLLLVATYSTGDRTITGVTYNGVGLTQLATQTSNAGTITKLWGLLSPATGSNTLSVAFTGTTGTVTVSAQSYTGVLQSGLPDATAVNTTVAGPTSLTKAITTVAASCWIATCCGSDSGVAPTAGSGITLLDSGNSLASGDSNGAVSAGSNSQTWNINAGGGASMVQASFAPAATVAAPDGSPSGGAWPLPRTANARHLLGVVVSPGLALLYPAQPPGVSTRAWHWPNPMWRKSDHAARHGFLKPTNQWAVPDFSSALIYITVNGVPRAYGHASADGSIQSGSLTVNDVLDQTPNTCDFVAQDFTPTVGMRVIMALGGITNPDRIFAGSILTVTPVYLGQPANQVFQVHCIDDTWQLDRVKVIKTYTNMAAGEIAYDLMATYAPGFTTHHVSSDLDVIDVITFTNTDLSACLTQLAKRVGAYWRIDYFSDLWLAETESAGANPTDLTPAHPSLSDFASSITIGEIFTRERVEGGGGNALSPVAVGDTILPVDLQSVNGTIPWYNALGGAVVCGTQRITYTGVQAGGLGSLVGPGIGPTAPPTVSPAAGAGVESGVHTYAVTFVTASGESLPSAQGTVTVGTIAAPSAAPTAGSPSSGGSLTAGDHYYAVTFVTASGETTPSAISATETATDGITDPSAQIAFWFSTGGGAGGPLSDGTYQWGYTFVNANGETTLGSSTYPATGEAAGSKVYPTIPAGPAGTTARRYYRTSANGSTLKLVAEIAGNVSTNYSDTTPDASLGVAAPSSNTTNRQTVALTAIQTGPAVVTARKLYRTAAGGSQLKLLATIADNATTTYTDTLADASLGVNAPSSNTATANQVAVSTIQVYSGSGTVTARKLYRTVAAGSQLKLLTTIADNTTTTYTDATADASLGANVPTSDTSNLPQGSGSVLAGSSTLLVAGVSWASATGGWAVIGNGQQVIRYTGISGNTLTGIPTSGIGAIQAPANYNSTVSAAPCLTGIPASSTGAILYAINKGDPVNLLVQVDDTDAQAALSALLDPQNLLGGAAGIKEDYLQDNRLSETEARARGTARLALMSRAQVSVTYRCRDPLTASGRDITINLPAPQSVAATLKIQQVTISSFTDNSPTLFPTYAVQASTVRFSFEDLVRQTRQLLNG